MMHKVAGIIRRLFVLFFILYATSSMMGEMDMTPAGGITAERTTVAIKILNIDRIMALLFDSDDSREDAGNEVGDDFLVRKFRSLPGGQSLSKLMLLASQTQAFHIAEQLDSTPLQTGFIPHDIIIASVPKPFEGYGTLHSGLAPPSLLS